MGGGPWGGSETLWYKMACYLQELGHEVSASVFKWPQTPSPIIGLSKNGTSVHYRKRTTIEGKKGKAIGFFNKIAFGKGDLLRIMKDKPDVLFFSLGSAFDLSAEPYGSFVSNLKIPYFVYLSLNTEYEILPFPQYQLQRDIFKNAKNVFFPSFRNLETAKRQLCTNLNNGVVINNPITFNSTAEMPFLNSDIISFASVARLDAFVKGQGVLLEIFSKKEWHNRKWKLNIYGKGNDEKYLMELSKFYKLEDRVSFFGHVNDIRSDIWANNHVLLMPSQYEGCPISLYDAAICSRPSVVSDVGGNAEFVENGFNGYVAEAPSVKSFGASMEKLWQSKNEMEEFGKNARKKALSILDLSPEKTIIQKFILPN